MVLYIAGEICYSLEQLKGYFCASMSAANDVFYDLLECGRSGDIAQWLSKMNEVDMAEKVNKINTGLSDTEYVRELCDVINGNGTYNIKKPNFEKCFKIEESKTKIQDNKIVVSVRLRILMSIKENYEISVKSNWGSCEEQINSEFLSEGEIKTINFVIPKNNNTELGSIEIEVDNKFLCKLDRPRKVIKLTDEVSINMVFVEGISFVDEYGLQRTVADFYCSELPITTEQWEAVMKTRIHGEHEDIVTTSESNCDDFISALNNLTGNKFRMLTNIEWQFVCKYKCAQNTPKCTNKNECDFFQLADLEEFKPEFVYESTIGIGTMENCLSDNIMWNPRGRESARFRIALPTCEQTISAEEYVDLGLSVNWSITETGSRYPSRDECEELLKKCSIADINESYCYIIGNNHYLIARKDVWYPINERSRCRNKTIAISFRYKQVSEVYDKNIVYGSYLSVKSK